jgi:hypothetical protein
LGHIISEQGVSVDPAKIQAVIEWPPPIMTKGVRGFLGLAGYYRKFIHHFGCIATPLTRLLSKDGFQWNEAAKMAFQQLKEALTSPPILRLPDFTQRFVIECDASGIRLGAILLQQNQPVAYFSEALKGSALALSTYEKKCWQSSKPSRNGVHTCWGNHLQSVLTTKVSNTSWSNESLHQHEHVGCQNYLVMITKLSIKVGLKIKVQIHYHVQLNSNFYPFLNHVQIGGHYFRRKCNMTLFMPTYYTNNPLKPTISCSTVMAFGLRETKTI